MNDETTRATIEAVKRLDAAFDRGDIDAFMAAMTDDCVWESFTPAPDGQRHHGQAAVRQAMADFLDSSPVFDGEEMLACGDRATVRWNCRFRVPADRVSLVVRQLQVRHHRAVPVGPPRLP